MLIASVHVCHCVEGRKGLDAGLILPHPQENTHTCTHTHTDARTHTHTRAR